MNIVYLLLSVTGLLVSVYITLYRYKKARLYCPRGNFVNCKMVLDTDARILGIPTAVYGIPFFLLEIVFSYFIIPELLLALYNLVGTIYVFWFISTEVKVKRLCLYCTVVHAVTILLFLLSLSSLFVAG